MTTKGIRVRKTRKVIIQTREEIGQTPQTTLLYQTTCCSPENCGCLPLARHAPLPAEPFPHPFTWRTQPHRPSKTPGCLGQVSLFMAPTTPGTYVTFLIVPLNLLVSYHDGVLCRVQCLAQVGAQLLLN